MIRLQSHAVILAPPERCFDLARSIDAHADSSRLIDGRAVAGRTSGLAELHDRTTWSARFSGLRFRLATRITGFERPFHLRDELCEGLFTHFGHEYLFKPIGSGRTAMLDDFCFQSPLRPLGTALDALVLRSQMQVVARARVLFLKRVAESEQWRRYVPDVQGLPMVSTRAAHDRARGSVFG